MPAPTALADASSVTFARSFHVEVFRGGMNRLLLRSYPAAEEQTRVEIFFQYVQYVETPMSFRVLTVRRLSLEQIVHPVLLDTLRRVPTCHVFRLESGEEVVGHIVAAACAYGEDSAPLGAPSMFPMMTE